MPSYTFESAYQDRVVPIDAIDGDKWVGTVVDSRDPARDAKTMGRSTLGFFYEGEAAEVKVNDATGGFAQINFVDVVTTNDAGEEVMGDRSPTYWLDAEELSGSPEDIWNALVKKSKAPIAGLDKAIESGRRVILDRYGRSHVIDDGDVILSSSDPSDTPASHSES